MFERLRCWRRGHAILMARLRDHNGRPVVPSTLVWTCAHCGATLGTTTTVVFRLDPLRLPSTTVPERTRHVVH